MILSDFETTKIWFTDARVGRSYLFTFKYAIVCTIIVNVISLLLALGLNAKIKGKTVLRGIYFIPNILGGLVIGYIFSFFFTYILPAAGQAAGIEWLCSSILAKESTAWFGISYCRCMAGNCNEYHHLYFRSADRAGRCV